jgi:hypothetical protein
MVVQLSARINLLFRVQFYFLDILPQLRPPYALTNSLAEKGLSCLPMLYANLHPKVNWHIFFMFGSKIAFMIDAHDLDCNTAR